MAEEQRKLKVEWKPTKDPRIKLRGDVYWARFMLDKRLIRQSLKTKSFLVAQKLVERIHVDILTNGYSNKNLSLFKDAWPEFLHDKTLGVYTKKSRPRTQKEYYDFGLRYFLDFWGHYQIAKIKTTDFTEYVAWINKNHVGVKKFFNHEKYLNAFFTWAYNKELIVKKPKFYNPDKLKGEDENEFEPGTLITDQQLTFILSFGEGSFNVFVHMMAYLGMRPGEVSQLKKDRIDLDKKLIRLRKSDTKTKQSRDVPIHPQIFDLVLTQFHSTESEYLFPNRDDIDRPMGRDGFGRQWDNMRKVSPDLHKISPHDMRHTYATKIFSNPHLNPMLACKSLGMSMATALKHYIHFDETQLHLLTKGFKLI